MQDLDRGSVVGDAEVNRKATADPSTPSRFPYPTSEKSLAGTRGARLVAQVDSCLLLPRMTVAFYCRDLR